MVDASGLPRICRSKTGVAETEEPCTKRIVPRRGFVLSLGLPTGNCLRHRKSLTSSEPTRLRVQCSVPGTSASASDSVLPSARTSSSGKEAAAHAAPTAPRKSRREPNGEIASAANANEEVFQESGHFGISTSVTSLTRLFARTKLPSRVTDVFRTMFPPPGIAQLWKLAVFGSKRTTVFGVASDPLYQMMSLIAEMP